jgi:chromate reductase
MPESFRILGIAGSLRTASYNRGMLRAAVDVAPAGVTILPCEIGSLPLYDGDIEVTGDPQPVLELKESIRSADALLISTPEYNTSIPGVLKNAIDWASRPPMRSPLWEKPVGVMGASWSRFGTVRAQTDLRKILHSAGCLVLPNPQIYVANGERYFDDKGRLNDDETREQIGALLEALVSWSRRLRPD